MYLLALRIQYSASKWHKVLPADQATEDSLRCLNGAQCRAVPHAPYHAFAKRGHELAMPPKDHAIGTEIQQGVVQGAGPRRTFGDTNGHRHVIAAACGGDALRLGTRDGDRLLGEAALQGSEGFGIGHSVIVVERVARNERLREDGEPRAMLCHLGDTCGGALSASHGVKVDRRRLDSGDDSHDILLLYKPGLRFCQDYILKARIVQFKTCEQYITKRSDSYLLQSEKEEKLCIFRNFRSTPVMLRIRKHSTAPHLACLC